MIRVILMLLKCKASFFFFFKLQVTLVRWNEPYQKLATCDVQGAIFVWIKHEGRWSTELINDRNSQVILLSPQ